MIDTSSIGASDISKKAMPIEFLDFNVYGLSRKDLEARLSENSISAVHAKSVFRSLYKDLAPASDASHHFPRQVEAYLNTLDLSIPLSIVSEQRSSYDRSIKFAVKLHDDQKVEMVLMPESKRITLCISSQVGCAQGCTFCHTGRMGLLRNLKPSEIIGQVYLANLWIKSNPDWLAQCKLAPNLRITNIVFMGMGEPLDNVESVSKALDILTDPFGLYLAKRKISVSTAGHIDGLDALLENHPDVMLAISVHSATDSERSKIMPINRRFPLDTLIQKLRNLPLQQKNGLLLQYTLIQGVNDSDDHALKLVNLVKGMNVKINIIPLNPVGPSRLKGPTTERLGSFRKVIHDSGIRALVRYSKAQDIAGACGQLVNP